MLTSPEPLPGLVVRGPDGRVERIVEQTDATPEELEIREGNTGVYLVDFDLLASALAELDSANAQARALPHGRGRDRARAQARRRGAAARRRRTRRSA